MILSPILTICSYCLPDNEQGSCLLNGLRRNLGRNENSKIFGKAWIVNNLEKTQLKTAKYITSGHTLRSTKWYEGATWTVQAILVQMNMGLFI